MFGATYLIIFPRFMFTRIVEILITTCEQRTFIGCQKAVSAATWIDVRRLE